MVWFFSYLVQLRVSGLTRKKSGPSRSAFTSLDFEPLFRSLRGRRKKGRGRGEGEKCENGEKGREPLSPRIPLPFFPSSPSPFRRLLRRLLFRACLNGGGGPQVGELILSAGVKSCYVHVSRWAASHMVEI